MANEFLTPSILDSITAAPRAPEAGFPSFRYGPGGEARVFNSADEVPEGWEDHPSKVKEASNDDDALAAGTAADIIASIDENTDLDALEAAEKDREAPRKGVLAAIEKARKARAE